MRTGLTILVLLTFGVVGCENETTEPDTEAPVTETAPPMDASEPAPAAEAPAALITLGNGESNWIVVEGVKRSGDMLTFAEVQIDGNGWLVLHPFENGKPVGARYVGASFIESGKNQDVDIQLDAVPSAGETFLVMLHSDVNENREFDFVFVDDRNVLDRAVFEGTQMIAHPFQVP